jgi:hypothetical protein
MECSMAQKEKPRFQNVAVPLEDHALLKELADFESRSMARELSVLIREAYRQIVQGHPV